MQYFEASISLLIGKAESDHAMYPQYKGHWNGWKLCRVKKTIRTKMGVAFVKGDIALARPNTETIEYGKYAGKESRTVYSCLNRCNTCLLESEIEML